MRLVTLTSSSRTQNLARFDYGRSTQKNTVNNTFLKKVRCCVNRYLNSLDSPKKKARDPEGVFWVFWVCQSVCHYTDWMAKKGLGIFFFEILFFSWGLF